MTGPPPSNRSARRLPLIAFGVLWVGAFVATHIPVEHLPDTHVSDKALHAVGFFVLGSSLCWLFTVPGRATWRRAMLVMMAATVYAAFDEATQPLVNRYAAWSDWLADVAGAAGAVAMWEAAAAWRRWRSSRSRKEA